MDWSGARARCNCDPALKLLSGTALVFCCAAVRKHSCSFLCPHWYWRVMSTDRKFPSRPCAALAAPGVTAHSVPQAPPRPRDPPQPTGFLRADGRDLSGWCFCPGVAGLQGGAGFPTLAACHRSVVSLVYGAEQDEGSADCSCGPCVRQSGSRSGSFPRPRHGCRSRIPDSSWWVVVCPRATGCRWQSALVHRFDDAGSLKRFLDPYLYRLKQAIAWLSLKLPSLRGPCWARGMTASIPQHRKAGTAGFTTRTRLL